MFKNRIDEYVLSTGYVHIVAHVNAPFRVLHHGNLVKSRQRNCRIVVGV